MKLTFSAPTGKVLELYMVSFDKILTITTVGLPWKNAMLDIWLLMIIKHK